MYNFLFFKNSKKDIRKPWFFENSRVPALLSHIAPIDIYAIALGPFVWCKEEMDDVVKNHETIHFHQQLELLFVGQWFLYVMCWLTGLIHHKDGEVAYRMNPFEQEAYNNEANFKYLKTRKLWAWRKY